VTSNFKELYQELFEHIYKEKRLRIRKPLTSFAALSGNEYSHELMVVGRSVNGWNPQFSLRDLEKDKASEIIDKVFTPEKWLDPDDPIIFDNPILWFSKNWGRRNGYNTKRSAFWRVIHSIVKELGVADVSSSAWPSFICWSNLYKVSPAERGNPSEKLMKTQHNICARILRKEVTVWKPRRVLFLTGMTWAEPFLNEMEFRPGENLPPDPIEADGTIFNRSKVVVGPHPQCKPEKPLVDSIKAVFGVT